MPTKTTRQPPLCTICGTRHGEEIHCGGTPTFIPIERAREIATQAMSESDGAICGISDCPTCIDAVTKALIDSDRAARRETLEWVRAEVLWGFISMEERHNRLERRLKELKHAG